MALFTIAVSLLLVLVLIGTAGITTKNTYLQKQIQDRDKALEILTRMFMSGDDDNE